MRSATLSSVLLAVGLSSATHLTIPAGEGSVRYVLDPGDLFSFIFVYKNLVISMVQTSFDAPCFPLAGGFSSGVVDPSQFTGGAANFTIQITGPDPIYFGYAGSSNGEVMNFCQLGDLGCINCPVDDFEQFVSNGQNATGMNLTYAEVGSGTGKGSGTNAQVLSLDPAFDVPFWTPSATSEQLSWPTAWIPDESAPIPAPVANGTIVSGSAATVTAAATKSSASSHVLGLSNGAIAAIAISVAGALCLGLGVFFVVRRRNLIKRRLERFALFRMLGMSRLQRENGEPIKTTGTMEYIAAPAVKEKELV